MGGSIFVESKLGKGSTFHFTIPLEPLPEQTPESLSAPPADGKIRVMVLSDRETNRGALAEQLVTMGIRATLIENEAEAMACIRESSDRGRPFGAVIVDMVERQERGLAFAEDLSESEKGRETTAILLTSLTKMVQENRGDENTGIAMLTKPVRRKRLYEVLQGTQYDETLSERSAYVDREPWLEKENSDIHKILLVEDNAVNRKVILRTLEKKDYHCDIAVNGVQALAALETTLYDLILMDCQMPEMDGFETTRRIRRLPGPAREIPIVALTANALPGDREKCLGAGMDAYLSKPFRNRKLYEILDHYLAGKRQRPGVSRKRSPDPA